MENVKELLGKYKLYLVMGGVILIILCWFLGTNKEEDIEIESEEIITKEPLEEKEEVLKFKIDIKGEVMNPGVYEVEEGMIVNDAIDLAGGLKEDADTTDINLSQKLVSEMVIVISTKDKRESTFESKVSVGSITSNKVSDSKGKVSLNKGTLEELMTLTGIGEAKAKNIIEYRSVTPFTSIEEITKVKGIGEATFEKNKERLTI